MKTSACLLAAVSLWTVSDGLAGENSQIQFSFGTNKPVAGFTVVQATNLFHPGAAFGFEPGVSVRAQGDCVTSDRAFLFSVRLGTRGIAMARASGNPM